MSGTGSPLSSRRRLGRNAEIAKLGVKVGANYATTAARKIFASAERKEALDHSRELKNAAEIAEQPEHDIARLLGIACGRHDVGGGGIEELRGGNACKNGPVCAAARAVGE